MDPAFDDGEVVDLKVVVDISSLRRSSMGSITGGVWFEFGDSCFPSRGWSDFVVVVLGWWQAELRALPAVKNPRATVALEFMDAPLSVRVSAPDGEDDPWRARMVRRGASHEQTRADIRFHAPTLRESIARCHSAVAQASADAGW